MNWYGVLEKSGTATLDRKPSNCATKGQKIIQGAAENNRNFVQDQIGRSIERKTTISGKPSVFHSLCDDHLKSTPCLTNTKYEARLINSLLERVFKGAFVNLRLKSWRYFLLILWFFKLLVFSSLKHNIDTAVYKLMHVNAFLSVCASFLSQHVNEIPILKDVRTYHKNKMFWSSHF